MKNIEDILLELVSVQSDTGTKKECEMAQKIYEMINRHPYFLEHPEFCGTYEKNDVLQRPVVWALRKGNGNKTVILTGHYDAVEIESFGALKPYALIPSVLKEKLKRTIVDDNIMHDLENDDWAFGRGIADMKAGLAINMHTLFTNNNKDVNILFMAVPDEENMSSGALQSIQLYKELQEKFNLEYRLSIISEPQLRSVEQKEDYHIFGGSIGKILPIIMAKGVLTHSADIFNGLNSGFIIAEIIRNLELSTDIISEDMGTFSQPPTVQIFKDLKTSYDVSVPEYSVACFNILFLKSKTPLSIIEDLKKICEKSLDFIIDKYNAAFETMASKGFLKEEKRKNFKSEVLTLSQLEERVKNNKKDFSFFKEELDKFMKEKIEAHEMTLQSASIHYMKSLLEISGITHPIVIIGISPPYYPAVNNRVLSKDIGYCLEGLSKYMKEKYGIGTKELPYFWGISDMSYMSSVAPKEERAFLSNLTLPTAIYDVPVEAIAELNIPSLTIGPTCKDIHQIGERVYMPDVKERIPAIFEKIIDRV